MDNLCSGSQYADYFGMGRSEASPDGKLVFFNSDMNGSATWQVFMAKVPTS